MPLLTKSFIFMYDPHRLRRNDRRFYTRKGQIIQAKAMSAPFDIERSKIEAYKEYILKNHLIDIPPPLPPVPVEIQFDEFRIQPDEAIIEIPINSLQYASEPYNYTIPNGERHLVIMVTQLEENYDLAFHFYSNRTITIPEGYWFITYPDIRTVNNLWVHLCQNDTSIMNVQLMKNTVAYPVQDIELSKFYYTIPLTTPASSE